MMRSKDGFLTLAETLETEFRCAVSVVDIPEELPNKWDIADPIPEGCITRHKHF